MNVECSAIVFLNYSWAFNIHFTKRKFVLKKNQYKEKENENTTQSYTVCAFFGYRWVKEFIFFKKKLQF